MAGGEFDPATTDNATTGNALRAAVRDAAQAHVPADPSPDVAVQLERALDAIARPERNA